MPKFKKFLGFTMIELLVVTTIMIILSTIGLASYRITAKNARDSKRRADLETVRQALVLRRSDIGSYPSDSGTGAYEDITDVLMTDGYLSSPKPRDPKYPDSEYTYAGDGVSFTLTAILENQIPTAYSVTSP